MDRRHSDEIAVIGLHRRGLVGLGVAAAWGALLLAVRAAGSVDALLAWVPFRCPLRLFTGIECPTCGLGHALVEAATGHFAASWHHHPGGVVLWVVALAGWMAAMVMPRASVAALARVQAFPARRAVVAAAFLYTLWGFSRAS